MDRFNCLTHIYEPALFLPPENVVPSTEVIKSCLQHRGWESLTRSSQRGQGGKHGRAGPSSPQPAQAKLKFEWHYRGLFVGMCEHKIPDCTRPPFVSQTFSQQPLSTWGQAFPPHLRVNFEFQIMLHNNRNLWKTWQGHVSSAPQVREHEPLLLPFSPREHFCNQRFDKDGLTKLWSSFSAHMWIIFLGFCLENLSLNLINWNMS